LYRTTRQRPADSPFRSAGVRSVHLSRVELYSYKDVLQPLNNRTIDGNSNSEVVNGTPAGKQVISTMVRTANSRCSCLRKLLRLLSRSRDRCEFYPSRTGKSTPRTRAKNQNGGAGVPPCGI